MAVLRNPCPSGSPRKVEQGTIGLQQSAESTFVSMQGGVRFWQQLHAPDGDCGARWKSSPADEVTESSAETPHDEGIMVRAKNWVGLGAKRAHDPS